VMTARDRRPNILFVMTDQQSAHMMSCTGNTSLKTPALDGLAASGVRFERAYSTNPVCVPSRFSLQTGRMPSSIGMKWNQDLPVPDGFIEQSLGARFNAAGYETVYAGKVHMPGALKEVEQYGYECLTADARQGLADACAAFIKEEHAKPFFLFASFVNPHDICYLAINDAMRAVGKEPIDNRDSRTCEEIADAARCIAETPEGDEVLTALPSNHGTSVSEPEAIGAEFLQDSHLGVHFRRHARERWGEKEWRVFRHTYRRLTEMVDAKIGQVLEALRDAGLEEDTLVVFTSDHGDMDGAHRLQHKSVLYEESVRIPFIMSHKGVLPAGVIDDEHLVSNGLDLLPTLCDAAGITCPEGLHGRSVLPVARGDAEIPWRDHVVVESRHGRMLRTERSKYSIHASGKNAEQLIDLKNDPGEMTNLAGSEKHKDILDQHRRLLAEWVGRTGDGIGAEYVVGEDFDK
jgi:arylsulfatase A-like enzyme